MKNARSNNQSCHLACRRQPGHIDSATTRRIGAKLSSVVEFPSERFDVENFCQVDGALTQTLSADSITGESTQRVFIPKGWTAPIGHFDTDVEVFVLTTHQSGRLYNP